MLSQFSKLGS